MSSIRLFSLVPLLAGSLLAAPLMAQQNPPAKKLYCWNQDGQRVCSDTLPPEAVNAARDEFNARSGLRSGQVDRALNADERTEATLAQVRAEHERAAEQSRQRTEQIAEHAARLLIAQIHGGDVENEGFSPELVVRGSTAPPRPRP